MTSGNKWSIYLLTNGDRSYIGCTTDVHRRLREHNGELTGGARSTRGKGPWILYSYVTGFENRSSAMRWEKISKSRARGLRERFYYFIAISEGICLTGNRKGRKQYPVPAGLTLTRPTKEL